MFKLSSAASGTRSAPSHEMTRNDRSPVDTLASTHCGALGSYLSYRGTSLVTSRQATFRLRAFLGPLTSGRRGARASNPSQYPPSMLSISIPEHFNARGLSRFLLLLLGDTSPDSPPTLHSPELVWTLPRSHHLHTVRGRSYLESCMRLINEATKTLTLVSPFVDPAGIGTLSRPLLAALIRGVEVRLFAHDALNLGTPTSRALEGLRREAERTKTDLSVFSAGGGDGQRSNL